MGSYVSHLRCGSDLDGILPNLTTGQAIDAGQTDDFFRLGNVILLEGHKVRAAGQQLGRAPLVIQETNCLLKRCRSIVGEVFHGLSLPSFASEGGQDSFWSIRSV